VTDQSLEIQRGADEGRALAAGCYRDPAFFDLEVERVLRPGWHAVGRWDDLPEPGDYASLDLCGEPLLLVRDADRVLRVYSRVCRHRAHTVVEGSGNTRRFICPYHAWSYGLDGQLKTAPLMDSALEFDRAGCGLPELRTETWQGFVFTTLDPDVPSMVTQLEPLTERFVPHGLAEMETVGVLEFDSPWNWKVMVDNFMESYHHLGTHTNTLQQTNHAQDTYPVDLRGPFALLENPGFEGAPDFYVAQVFPTLLLALFRGLAIGSWYEMQIDAHDHFRLRIHALASPELAHTEGFADGLLQSTSEIHHEDIPVCEGVQRGLASRLWEPGPLSGLEGSLIRFHRHLASCLRS
jgi:phenylpropionate dioxygenase-like ring-hydroxylating dioxygenase large terminal subunit